MKASVALTVTAVLLLPTLGGCDDDTGPGKPSSQPPGTAGVFLDISGKVVTGDAEQGLLGLAFHPDYNSNGYFFVYYTTTGGTNRLARYQAIASDPDSADQSSEAVLLEFPKRFGNHNGGQLAFGPDGYLYISVGDGGGGGEPDDNGQDLTTLLGTILRLDVDSQALGNYGIPPTNPFAINTKGYRPEIFAYGLRNTWRFSFDPVTGWLWAGDVGQNAWEEIDIVESGGNYGWDCYEGTHAYASNSLCDTLSVQIDPIFEYAHSEGNVSVTGGHVYRGPTLSSLLGTYVFADYASGRIWGIEYGGTTVSPVVELLNTDLNISAFGVDEANELYICDFDPGGSQTRIYRLAEAGSALELQVAFPDLTFQQPVDIQNPRDGTDRLFVVERRGVIKVCNNDESVTD